MENTVLISEKKDFIRWFLRMYQLKQRECVWILNFILNNDRLLKNVHFVENVKNCPRAIILSTANSTGKAFCFHKEEHIIMDAEKAFHDLRLFPDKELYIQINFKEPLLHEKYITVLEENPYLSIDEVIKEEDREIAEKLLTGSLLLFQEKQLLKQIDEALDKKDKNKFIELSRTFLEFQKKKET